LVPDLDEAIARAVDLALREDLGQDYPAGDITTEAIIGEARGSAAIAANQACVIAGGPVVAAVFAAVDPDLLVDWDAADGDRVAAGVVVARLKGELKAILKGERPALNFLSHLSGIATMTAKFVAAVAATGAGIYDTRKTTPGLRALEKYAVVVGGGHNHRFGLFDGILVKDNHLAGKTITEAISLARAARLKDRLRSKYPSVVEVEVETMAQLDEALAGGADIVLLDNMRPDMVAQAVSLAKGKAGIEVSGGISLDNVREIAMAGAERISVGAVTQGTPTIDFSLTVF